MTRTAQAEDAGAGTPRREWILFGLALAVYLASRLVGLTRYPVYFFGDEAIQGNLVEQLLKNGFRDQTGTLLPPYFLNDQRWAVSLSVYIHLVPIWLFGKTIATIRATTVAVTLVGAAAAGLALKAGSLARALWWTAPLLLAVEPVHFVHARLGFESILMASFFFCFLWAYFLYRYRSPRFLLLALAFGAATFYAYTAGQGVMLVTGLLLLVSDFGYHRRQNWRLLGAAAALSLVLAAPYARYRLLHPGVVEQQLKVLDSYWTHPIPLSAKLRHFGDNYVRGLDPRYWFRVNTTEFARHRMKDMPFFPAAMLPLAALGAGVCLWRCPRSSAHRAVLFSLPGVPFAAAMANLQILRLMAMIVPVTLLALVGAEQILQWVRRLVPPPALAGVLGAGLTAWTGVLTARAVTDGPTWFTDYGLYGLQYGAPQVFAKVREELARSPAAEVLVSSTWANNPSEYVLFFLSPEERRRVRIADVYEYDLRKTFLSGREIFVMTPAEYALASGSAKFVLAPEKTVIPYPDGKPGFYFVRLRYAPDADAVFARDRAERMRLVESTASIKGQPLTVRHSLLDMGDLQMLLDAVPNAMVRGKDVNPLVFEFVFPKPRPMTGLRLELGSMDNIAVRIFATPAGARDARRFSTQWHNRPPKTLDYTLPEGPMVVERLRLEIDEVGMEASHIEVRGLSFR